MTMTNDPVQTLPDHERRLVERAGITEEQRERLRAYLTRREISRARIGEISEGSFRAWLRRALGIDVKKERSS